MCILYFLYPLFLSSISYSSVDRHLECFTSWQLWIMLLYIWLYACISLRLCFHLSRIYTLSSIFNFFRIFHTVSHSGCNIAQSWQQCTRVPISPYPHQTILFSGFLAAFLMNVRWYVSVVLICISLQQL